MLSAIITILGFCADGAIRLQDGSFTHGRVEICNNEIWGTVCDGSWTSAGAKAVCIQLGLPSSCKLDHWQLYYIGTFCKYCICLPSFTKLVVAWMNLCSLSLLLSLLVLPSFPVKIWAKCWAKTHQICWWCTCAESLLEQKARQPRLLYSEPSMSFFITPLKACIAIFVRSLGGWMGMVE